jgi:hypothetical protein
LSSQCALTNSMTHRSKRQGLLRLAMSFKANFDLKNTLAVTFALVWAIGQLGQVFGGEKMFFLDGLMLVIVSLFIVTRRNLSVEKDVSFVVLLFVMTASFLLNIFDKDQSQIITAMAYLARISVIFAMYFVVIKNDKKLLKEGISLGLFVFLILSAAGYLFFPDARVLKLLGYDDHYYRAIGTLLDPNLSAVIYIWAFYWFSQFKDKTRFLSLLALCLLGLSFSRSAYLAFALSLILVVIRNRNIKPIGWLLALLVIVLIAPKPFGEGVNLARTYSIDSRISNTKENIKLSPTKFVLGKGFNFVSGELYGDKYTNRSSGVDNSYLFLWMTTGILGILAFGHMITRNYRYVTSSEWSLGAFGALLTHSVFNNSLFQLHILLLAVISLGYLRVIFHNK